MTGSRLSDDMTRDWNQLNESIVACSACPRLRQHCNNIGQKKRKAFASETYWARPVPNFGAADARLLVVGLAPAAHGANRTGRMFTGDRSGEWLYRALYRGRFATHVESLTRDDPLRLVDCAITAICHCAPPENKPTRDEQSLCQPWLEELLDVLPTRVYLALGQIAWDGLWRVLRLRLGMAGPRPKFAHGHEVQLPEDRWLIGCYHPSQQNTFTGRLTEPMLDEVIRRVRAHLEHPPR